VATALDVIDVPNWVVPVKYALPSGPGFPHSKSAPREVVLTVPSAATTNPSVAQPGKPLLQPEMLDPGCNPEPVRTPQAPATAALLKVSVGTTQVKVVAPVPGSTASVI